MDELSPANALLGDPEALRRRLARDGYLFFRSLLPAAETRAAADDVRAALHRGGWIDDRGHASADRRALNPRDALGDPAFRAALTSPGFNRLPYLAELRRAIRLILGPQAFSYPAKVLRAVYPERPPGVARGRYVHQDYAVSGVQDMLTTWVPLTDMPGPARRPGGAARESSRPAAAPARARPARARLGHHRLPGRRRAGLPLPDLARGAAQPRHLAAAVRGLPLAAPRPAGAAQLVIGPGGQRELFSRMFARKPWWEPVPGGMPLIPRERLAAISPGPSRYFTVHPGWKNWRHPDGAVH